MKAYGVSCLLNGLHNVATEAFTEMLEIDPSDGWANVHLGFALKADNKLEECIGNWIKFLSVEFQQLKRKHIR
jgi:cytochrome c-type biogenesis protein CcmH/NrfG